MEKYINKIYDLLYSPIITPYNLLENAKLDNYFYVNYYKDDFGLISEMKCSMEDGTEKIFFYHFDTLDRLDRVYMQDGNCKKLVFSRETELIRTKTDYLEKQKNKVSKDAI